MGEVFIYWDNSNIFIEAQRIAEERNDHVDARFRVRIKFDNMLRLAHADRPLRKAMAAGSVPPELRQLWRQLKQRGVSANLYDQGQAIADGQKIPELQLRMLEDGLDYSDNPGTAVLLTGDDSGYVYSGGFPSALQRMHRRGWKIEILSWRHSCNYRMREWAEENGVFVPLDDFYESITFLEPSLPGHRLAQSRPATPLDLSRRPAA